MGQPPAAATFHRFERPDMSVVKTISFPSGDHEPPDNERVKYRSSIGIARASGLDADAIAWGSETTRSSGPLDWAGRYVPYSRPEKHSIHGPKDFIARTP